MTELTEMTATKFIRWWFEKTPYEGQFLELTFIKENGTDKKVISKFLPLSNFSGLDRIVKYFQGQGFGAFFGVTASSRLPDFGRRREADVKFLSGLWLDVDTDTPEALSALTRGAVIPNYIIHSGGGFHAYFRLFQALEINDKNREEVKALLKTFIQSFEASGADIVARDLSRGLRIPDTINLKPKRKGAKVQMISAPSKLDSAYSVIKKTYGVNVQAERKKAPKAQNKPFRRYSPVPDYPDYVQQYLDAGAQEGQRNYMLFRVSGYFRFIGKSQAEVERLLLPIAVVGDFTREEAMNTIKSAFK